ncbi:MAG: sarcosine/dimethylglycine N-methyltransferase [Puniceicoccaceae bacterium 5H]|nr:MAG: sarcosine/dimethylglycine N-methyltransferase [Puniceicoccaceae bacterium 5H]
MSNTSAQEVEAKARQYYDSNDADNFYYQIWGGEDIHIGWYKDMEEPIFDASRRTVERMASKLKQPEGARLLDIGAGYGGSCRYLVKNKGYDCTALNLSVVQNDRDRQMNKEQGLDDRIDVVDGTFEDLPFEDNSFDMVWSQDAILHSGDRKLVFKEVDRVLKPGGEFIFTDPMQKPDVDEKLLAPVLARIDLSSMGSIEVYEQYAKELGWEVVEVERATEKLVMHYSRVLQELKSRETELKGAVSDDYIERMKTGLNHWIRAGEEGALSWGILHFRKKA